VTLTIHKTLLVAVDPQRAFEAFANELGDWWPLTSYSKTRERASNAVIEPRLGGSMHEVTDEGEIEPWATVKHWEPPHRIALDWHISPRKPVTQLEFVVTPDDGGARVDLYHGGWDALGEQAKESYAEYNIGWDFVLGHYLIAVGTVRV